MKDVASGKRWRYANAQHTSIWWELPTGKVVKLKWSADAPKEQWMNGERYNDGLDKWDVYLWTSKGGIACYKIARNQQVFCNFLSEKECLEIGMDEDGQGRGGAQVSTLEATVYCGGRRLGTAICKVERPSR